MSLTGTAWCFWASSRDCSQLFVCTQAVAMGAVVLSLARLKPVGGESTRRSYEALRGVLFLCLLGISGGEAARFPGLGPAEWGFGALWVLGAAVLVWHAVVSLRSG